MKDKYNRKIHYMRLSITDRCNFKCKYCIPSEFINNTQPLSFDEFFEISKCAVNLGIDKIRVTGGEPLIRDGIIDFLYSLSQLKGLKKLALTTNGSKLKFFAHALKASGVSSINISLDTINRDKFKELTGVDSLDDVLDGIELASKLDFDDIKLNVVLLGGFNIDEISDFVEFTKDNDITVRFIELMPIGECKNWDKSKFVSADVVLKTIPKLKRVSFDGVSEVYKCDGYLGRVGLIRPMSNMFCHMCNKIRITADGKIKTCLHSADEYDLKGIMGFELEEKIKEVVYSKPMSHSLSTNCFSNTNRYMNQIGG